MKASVFHGVITWNDEIDLSPDTLYLLASKEVSVPARKPIKPVYVTYFIALIDWGQE